MNITCVKPAIAPLYDSNGYDMFLGISSDTLVVFCSKQDVIVETIINGVDNDALLVECSDQDHFLDVICAVKCMITDGYNPKEWLLDK